MRKLIVSCYFRPFYSFYLTWKFTSHLGDLIFRFFLNLSFSRLLQEKMKEDFSKTQQMLMETVQPLCNFFHRLVDYKPKEELLYFLFPVLVLTLSAKHGVKCFLKANAVLSLLYGSLMIFYPEALLSITVNIFRLTFQLRHAFFFAKRLTKNLTSFNATTSIRARSTQQCDSCALCTEPTRSDRSSSHCFSWTPRTSQFWSVTSGPRSLRTIWS